MRDSRVAFWAVLLSINLLAAEVISALLLFHCSRTPASNAEGRLATAVLLRRSFRRLIDPRDPAILENRVSSVPSPFFTPDEMLGYSVGRGQYEVIFEQPRGKYKWHVSIGEEGQRATGFRGVQRPGQIYLFGDSLFFGWGLNDQHVFAWLLQQEFFDHRIHNYAMSGYGNVHGYLQLQRSRSRITADDVLIFAYGDYLNERNCAAARRVKEVFAYAQRGSAVAFHAHAHPYAVIDGGELQIRHVSGDCRANGGWCDRPDPTDAEMADLTSRIFDRVLDSTEARVAVAVLRGEDDDPVLVHLRERQVPLIDLRPGSEFFERDDIAGFDQHPGPVAHYYYYVKLARYLRELGF